MQPFSTAIFSITVIISTISIYTSASITIDVLNSVFVAKILKKYVNFWIGRVNSAKLPRAFVEGVVLVFLLLQIVFSSCKRRFSVDLDFLVPNLTK